MYALYIGYTVSLICWIISSGACAALVERQAKRRGAETRADVHKELVLLIAVVVVVVGIIAGSGGSQPRGANALAHAEPLQERNQEATHPAGLEHWPHLFGALEVELPLAREVRERRRPQRPLAVPPLLLLLLLASVSARSFMETALQTW